MKNAQKHVRYDCNCEELLLVDLGYDHLIFDSPSATIMELHLEKLWKHSLVH